MGVSNQDKDWWVTITVEPMLGIWRAPFALLRERIDAGGVPLHTYQQRTGDTRGNARDSYLFDLNSFECLACRDGLLGGRQRDGS